MKRLFGALGYRVEVVVLGNWRRCLLDAAAGRVDLILAYRTPARDRDLAFSAEPVLREDVAIFYNRQRPVRIQSLGDLAGYRGGLLFGESYRADFDRFVGRHGNVEWVSDSRQNFGKLVRQRIDYIAHERRTGTLFAERPGRRREHPCAARTADGGLPAGGGLAALAAGGEDGRDRPGPAWLSRRRQHPALAGRQRARLSAPRRQPRGRLVSGHGGVLARRLLWRVLLFSLCFTVLAGAVQLFFEYRREMREIEARLELIRSGYLASFERSLWDLNQEQLNVQLRGLGDFPTSPVSACKAPTSTCCRATSVHAACCGSSAFR